MLNLTERDYTAEDLISSMTQAGVDRAVVMGSGRPPEIMKWNGITLEAIKRYSDRLLGFVCINPLLEDAMETIDSYVKIHGFKGIKLHPMRDCYPPSNPAAQKVLESASRLKVPVMIHSGTSPFTTPGQVASLAEMYPEVPVILAHAGSSEIHGGALPAAKRAKNIILESSMNSFSEQDLTTAVRTIGADRVIYGSNWPCGSMKAGILKVKRFSISSEDKTKIFGENLARILGLRNEIEG